MKVGGHDADALSGGEGKKMIWVHRELHPTDGRQ